MFGKDAKPKEKTGKRTVEDVLHAHIIRQELEIERLNKYAAGLEERLILVLDPVAYNQMRLHQRNKIGAQTPTAEEARRAQEARDKLERDKKGLEELEILTV